MLWIFVLFLLWVFLFVLGGSAFDFVCLIALFELLPYVEGQGRDEGRTGGTGMDWGA